MSIRSAKAGDDDFLSIRFAIAIRVLNKQDVGGIRDPDTTMSDRDTAGDVESLHKCGEPIGSAITIGIFQNFDPIFAGPRFATGIFERLGDPETASFVDGHRDGVDDIGLGGDDLD